MPRTNEKKKKTTKKKKGSLQQPQRTEQEEEDEEERPQDTKNERKARRAARMESSTLKGIDESLSGEMRKLKFTHAAMHPSDFACTERAARDMMKLVNELKALPWTDLMVAPRPEASLKVLEPFVERARSLLNDFSDERLGLSPAIGYLFKNCAGLRQRLCDQAGDDELRRQILRDCTEAVKIYERCCGVGGKGAFGAKAVAEFRCLQSLALWWRGRARRDLGDDAAVDDYVAAQAAMRLGTFMASVGIDGRPIAEATSRDYYLDQILRETLDCLAAMALDRGRDTSDPRSYLSPERRKKYRKDLRLGEYHPSRYKCHGCGWDGYTRDNDPRSSSECDKHLRICSGCLRVFYCSQACMRAHWKVHKRECQLHDNDDDNSLHVAADPAVLAHFFRRRSFVGPGTTPDMPLMAVVLNDDNQPFDLLTDKNVLFVPTS